MKRNVSPSSASLVLAFATIVFLTGFSGLFFLETERIWIFFVPFLTLIAASSPQREESGSWALTQKLVLILSLLLSVGQEMVFQDYT
jgi:hypothetical protein